MSMVSELNLTSLFSFIIAATAGSMFVDLLQVTRDNLRDAPSSLWASFAGAHSAPQINSRLRKVELSMCVFPTINMYCNYDSSPIC